MTTARAISIELPLPPPLLHQNNGGRTSGWQAQAQAKREARLYAKLTARNLTTPPIERCTVSLIFRFPDKRRRDIWNYAAACKQYLDGLVDAGIMADDSGIIAGDVTGSVEKGNPGVTIIVREIMEGE